MTHTLYTIGHSNHDINTFIALLKQHGVTALADVRSAPYSRYLPHFCKKTLKAYLAKEGIQYVFLGNELGARPDDETCYVDGKALYEKIAATKAFSMGLKRVLRGSETFDIALMCAEKDPLTCHRAILVCQHLKPLLPDIHHILGNGELETHQHLEERMLTLHGFMDAVEPHNDEQLSLFNALAASPLSAGLQSSQKSRSPDEVLREAYKLQGDDIAYVEKSHDANH
jgi:uncharacterized protein (DUF488 family)